MAQVSVELTSEELGALDAALAKGDTRETYCEKAVKAALASKQPKALAPVDKPATKPNAGG